MVQDGVSTIEDYLDDARQPETAAQIKQGVDVIARWRREARAGSSSLDYAKRGASAQPDTGVRHEPEPIHDPEKENKERDFVTEGNQRVCCNHCEMVGINGVPCHETGCPNERRVVDMAPDDLFGSYTKIYSKKSGSYRRADAYIECGGMYEHRRLTLDEYKGVYGWTDWDASDELNLGNQVGGCSAMEEARVRRPSPSLWCDLPISFLNFCGGTSGLRHFTPRVSALSVGESFLLQDELFDLSCPVPEHSCPSWAVAPNSCYPAARFRLLRSP
jgi:hypothetical protein